MVFLKKSKLQIVKVGSNSIIKLKESIMAGDSEVSFYEPHSMVFSESGYPIL